MSFIEDVRYVVKDWVCFEKPFKLLCMMTKQSLPVFKYTLYINTFEYFRSILNTFVKIIWYLYRLVASR